MEKAEKTVEKLAKDYRKTTAKQMYGDELGFIAGFSAKEKIVKQKLKDSYNKYNSWLKELNNPKLDKVVNHEERVKLESKIELLKELLNEKATKN